MAFSKELSTDRVERLRAHFERQAEAGRTITPDILEQLERWKQIIELQEFMKRGRELTAEQIAFMHQNQEREFYDLKSMDTALTIALREQNRPRIERGQSRDFGYER